MAITAIMIFRVLQRQVGPIIPTRMRELAVLVRALSGSLEAVTAGFRQAKDMENQNREQRPEGDAGLDLISFCTLPINE